MMRLYTSFTANRNDRRCLEIHLLPELRMLDLTLGMSEKIVPLAMFARLSLKKIEDVI